MIHQFFENMMEQHDETTSWKNSSQGSKMQCNGLLIDDWMSVLAQEGQMKRFQYCLNPNSFKQFIYFRAIQRHSGGHIVDFFVAGQCTVAGGLHRVHLPRRECN